MHHLLSYVSLLTNEEGPVVIMGNFNISDIGQHKVQTPSFHLKCVAWYIYFSIIITLLVESFIQYVGSQL